MSITKKYNATENLIDSLNCLVVICIERVELRVKN